MLDLCSSYFLTCFLEAVSLLNVFVFEKFFWMRWLTMDFADDSFLNHDALVTRDVCVRLQLDPQ